MEDIDILVVVGSAAVVAALVTFIFLLRKQAKRLMDALTRTECEKSELSARLKTALDVEAEAASLRAALEKERNEVEQQRAQITAESDRLREQYTKGLKTYETLEAEIRTLEEDLENITYGLPKPHFTYSDTEAYKAAIQSIREKQKAMIKAGQAATCGTSWSVGGSKREGERMVQQYAKLILRAFNGESEAAIANVAWNNYRVMRQRIEKAFEALNKLGTVMQVSLRVAYKETRVQELQLVFEAAEKRQQEREEQRRLRAERREEERVQRELQREREEAEKDEAAFEKALVRASRELEKA
jgi:chromosome segregation ATPase